MVAVVQENPVAAVELVVQEVHHPETWVSAVEVRPFADSSSSWTVEIVVVVGRYRAVHLRPARR